MIPNHATILSMCCKPILLTLIILLTPICSGCWGGGAWMLQMGMSATFGGRVNQEAEDKHDILYEQIVKKYKIENRKRKKAHKPPLKIPKRDEVLKERYSAWF